MTSAKLRSLFSSGLTYDEIAEINERSEGWKPSRAAVKRKYEALGMPPRRTPHRDLLPWRVAPDHNGSVVRHMLQAEGRARQGRKLSDTDRKLTERLHEILFGRGTLMVATYHPEVGFAFVLREDTDEDIVRPQSGNDLGKVVRAVGDRELVEVAFRGEGRAEVLERAGRPEAASILRDLMSAKVSEKSE